MRACVRAYGCGCKGNNACLRACRVTYPVSNAHPPYCLRPLWLHHIFRHYLINGTIFSKKLGNIKCVFWFSLQLLFQTFLILIRIQRDIVLNVKRSKYSARYSCRILMKLEFSGQIFERNSNIKFHHNPSSGAALFHADGWSDGQTWRS